MLDYHLRSEVPVVHTLFTLEKRSIFKYRGQSSADPLPPAPDPPLSFPQSVLPSLQWPHYCSEVGFPLGSSVSSPFQHWCSLLPECCKWDLWHIINTFYNCGTSMLLVLNSLGLGSKKQKSCRCLRKDLIPIPPVIHLFQLPGIHKIYSNCVIKQERLISITVLVTSITRSSRE